MHFSVWRGFERLIFFRSVILLQILIIVTFGAYLPRTRDIRDTYLTIDRQDTDEIPC